MRSWPHMSMPSLPIISVAINGFSSQTLASCRDSFRLLLTFMQQTAGIEPSALCVADLDAATLLAFLDYLEGNEATRSALATFDCPLCARFSASSPCVIPRVFEMVTRVFGDPHQARGQELVGYLTRPEIDALIAAPDQSSWLGAA